MVMQETLTKLCVMQTKDTKVEGGTAGEQKGLSGWKGQEKAANDDYN